MPEVHFPHVSMHMYSMASITQINIIFHLFVPKVYTGTQIFSHASHTQHSTLLYILKSKVYFCTKASKYLAPKTSIPFDLHSLIHIMTAMVGITNSQRLLVRNLHFTMECNDIFELIELCTSPWSRLLTKQNHPHC